MGYRRYIGSISKKDYRAIKSITLEQYKADNDAYSKFRDSIKELHNFGSCESLYDKRYCKNFFKNKEMREFFDTDFETYIITKELLTNIIEIYTNKVKTYYQNLLSNIDWYKVKKENVKDIDSKILYDMIYHINGMSSEWNYLTPYDLYRGDEVTTSWKYEYNIFELVRIYKTFDWKKNYMVYYGR